MGVDNQGNTSDVTHLYNPKPLNISESLSFNGNDSKIDIDNIPFNTSQGSRNTIEFSFKYTGGNKNKSLIEWANSNRIMFMSGHFGLNTDAGEIIGIPSTALLDKWVSISIVLTNGVQPTPENTKFYVNGVEQETQAFLGKKEPKVFNTSPTLKVGNGKSTSTNTYYAFQGEIKNLKIWNTERTSSQIINNIDDSTTESESLVGYWELREHTNHKVYDLSILNNNGIVSGSDFSSPFSLNAAMTDIDGDISWNKQNWASKYVLKRDNATVYEGEEHDFKEQYLESETEYAYSVYGLSKFGESLSTSKTFSTGLGDLELLSVPTSISFNDTILDGTNKVSKGNIEPIYIKDSRKISEGWRLMISSSPLTSNDKQIPMNSLLLKSNLKIYKEKGSSNESINQQFSNYIDNG
ncbi:hypothetical protein HV454_15520 [Bacillus sporothermodurans]|nr:LamG-like jellyroll fold domain-containing protein [Heyndrickxia sporothermodurans]MBL5769012.1 hypothetical protein [Heyndrickxia sporothermodurans]MBL5772799.1 hypothetical protein [Heyndrickxia sporothermodurans]MBL5786887.1 hypothetical protein [Heyndrickxia sporothermodurans]MBL5790504.1 hypothetical protein [Heyndrickxia sporothermodurans]MBL5851581.1 hypothetical protein [Heyndrickxia sporothermodurans]